MFIDATPKETYVHSNPDIAYLGNMLRSEPFRTGYLEAHTIVEREQLNIANAAVERQAKIVIGRSIPVMAAEIVGCDQDTIKMIKARLKSGASLEDLNLDRARANALIGRWEIAVKQVSAEIEPMRPKLMEDAVTRLSQDSKYRVGIESATVVLEAALAKQNLTVNALIEEFEKLSNDPRLAEALEIWGKSPNAVGDYGEDNQGYNAGIIHYFEYRSSKEKNSRFFKEKKFGIEEFIEQSKHLKSLLDNPNPKNNPQIRKARVIVDENEQQRIVILTNDHTIYGTMIVGFARKGEPPKIITVIPFQDEATMQRSVENDLRGSTKRRFNMLTRNITEVPIDEFSPPLEK